MFELEPLDSFIIFSRLWRTKASLNNKKIRRKNRMKLKRWRRNRQLNKPRTNKAMDLKMKKRTTK